MISLAKWNKNRLYSNLQKVINNNDDDDDAYGENNLETTVFLIRIRW
jgi:hypothetical protein